MVMNAYGDQGLGLAGLFIACVTLLYNVLSVYILTPKAAKWCQGDH